MGVVGLGYVGLPLALAFADAGFRVLGFDCDSEKVSSIDRGESYIESVGAERLSSRVEGGSFSATGDLSRLGEPDAVLICVPTPLTPDRRPDLSFVEETSRRIADTLRPGQLIVLESTTYPGTTAEVMLPILASSGLECGRDFFLAYSPERENPGDKEYSTSTIPKVVGGLDPESGDLAEALYSELVPSVVRVSSERVAEATKLTENVFRAVNIALVNELKVIYGKMEVDVWEVLDAAETKPFGFMRFDPGPGLGGHCIPIDPFYLAARAIECGAEARFVELAGEINRQMPGYVVDRAIAGLEARGREVGSFRALVLGVAYKKDVDDPRESPAFDILGRLLARGAEVAYHDPHIPRLPEMRSWSELPALESEPLSAELLGSMDVVFVVTDHSSVDYDLVWEHSPLIVDTRGVFRRADPRLISA